MINNTNHFPHFWADAGPSGLIIAIPSLSQDLGLVMDGIRSGDITGYQCNWEAHTIEGIPFLFLFITWGNNNHRFTLVFAPKHEPIIKALKSPRDVLLVGSMPEETESGYLDFIGPMATLHQLTLDEGLQDTFSAYSAEIH